MYAHIVQHGYLFGSKRFLYVSFAVHVAVALRQNVILAYKHTLRYFTQFYFSRGDGAGCLNEYGEMD